MSQVVPILVHEPVGDRPLSSVGMRALGVEAGPYPVNPAAESIDAYYDAHFDDVWRVLRRLGVGPTSLDDAAQDVFLVAHRRLSEFGGRSSARTWLIGIAIRVAKDHRRRVHRKGGLESLPDELPDASAVGADELAERAQALRFLESFLASLSDDKREVFVLAELEELTAAEIGGLLGVNANTVASRLRAARALFERAIQRRRAAEGRSR